MPDHVHLLISLEPNIAISNIVKDIKVNSIRWMNQAPAFSRFVWQEGFGVINVSKSNTDAVVKYIENQKEHHQFSSFENDFIASWINTRLNMIQNISWRNEIYKWHSSGVQ